MNKHMDALLQVEAVISSQNTRALRRLFDNINCHVHSLRSLGIESDSYGNLLCPVLLNKIPADLQLIVSCKVSAAEWNLDLLMAAIEEPEKGLVRAKVVFLCAEVNTSLHPRRPPWYQERHPIHRRYVVIATSLIHPAIATPSRKFKPQKQSLRQHERCFSCLRKGHLVRDCRSTNRCCTCRGHHHTSVCGSSAQSRGASDRHPPQPPVPRSGTALSGTQTPATLPRQSVPILTQSTLNPGAPAFTSPPASTSLCTNSTKTVLLQTALAEISNPCNPTLVLNARIVMNSGSQKSYLTQRVKDSLSLPVAGTQHLSIAAFGSTRGEPKQCEVVHLAVRTKSGGNQELDLFIVRHICDPLTTQTVSTCSKMYGHLAQLDLADASQEETLEVDGLIGSDFYREFVTGENPWTWWASGGEDNLRMGSFRMGSEMHVCLVGPLL